MATYIVAANVMVQAAIDAAGLGPFASDELVAPPVMPSEALSSVHELRYRREITAALADQALEWLVGASYVIRQPPGLARAAWEVANRLGWAKTYDAEYVALARLLDLPLVTFDRRLARGASQLARIIVPGESVPGDSVGQTISQQ
jgi:predicted nucleic acid-binding protein